MIDRNRMYYVYKAACQNVVQADELFLSVDVGFRWTNEFCTSLFGINAADFVAPDDPDESRRGENQRMFTRTWIDRARERYEGDDGYPLAVRTLRDRSGDPGEYQSILYERASGDSLNDDLLIEFPEASEL